MGNVAFEALDGPPRLRVADTVGNEQYTLLLDSPVDPEPIPADGFTYPVSDAVRVELEGFELEGMEPIHLWNRSGELLAICDYDDEFEAAADEYVVELCRPLKTYLRVSGAVTARSGGGKTRVRFGSESTVVIGARSLRRRPAHTITTPPTPTDVMRAVSNLGDGLLTTTPSRAYPTLRGYPPDIELGAAVHVPEGIETGTQPVTLGLPPQFAYIFEAAPLVYYLNATVEPNPRPCIVVDEEVIYEFDHATFADEVESLLRHVFTLDCIVRSAGPYPIESVECDRLEGAIPFDLPDLYRAEQGARLRKYLEIPFELIAEQALEWPAIAHVEPSPDNLEAIPHLVAQLVPIRAVRPERLSGAEARKAALAAFVDTPGATRAATEVFDGEAAFVDVGSSGTTTDIWVGDDVPISANKLLVESFRNRFRRSPSENRSIDVTIVCNEAWMSEEATAVRRFYEDSDDLPFDVAIHEHVDRTSLAELLGSETDFLHYVGHATAGGLECSDGYLDVSTVESVGVETFFLNACQSYQQAKKLVEGGAIAGVATLSDITDDQAALVGRTAARLLNLGFPLRKALDVARSRSIVGGQYLVVGDGVVTLVPSEGVPNRCSITPAGERYELTIVTYHSLRAALGAQYLPWVPGEDHRYLSSKSIGPFDLSAAELREFLQYENVPVQYDGEFRWAFDLADDLD